MHSNALNIPQGYRKQVNYKQVNILLPLYRPFLFVASGYRTASIYRLHLFVSIHVNFIFYTLFPRFVSISYVIFGIILGFPPFGFTSEIVLVYFLHPPYLHVPITLSASYPATSGHPLQVFDRLLSLLLPVTA